MKKDWIVNKDQMCKRKVKNINLKRTLNMGKKLYKAHKNLAKTYWNRKMWHDKSDKSSKNEKIMKVGKFYEEVTWLSKSERRSELKRWHDY